jgi:hypothetical protein
MLMPEHRIFRGICWWYLRCRNVVEFLVFGGLLVIYTNLHLKLYYVSFSFVMQKMVSLMGAHFSKPLVGGEVTHLVCYKFEGLLLLAASQCCKYAYMVHTCFAAFPSMDLHCWYSVAVTMHLREWHEKFISYCYGCLFVLFVMHIVLLLRTNSMDQ